MAFKEDGHPTLVFLATLGSMLLLAGIVAGFTALTAWPVMLIIGSVFPAVGLSYMASWAATSVVYIILRVALH